MGRGWGGGSTAAARRKQFTAVFVHVTRDVLRLHTVHRDSSEEASLLKVTTIVALGDALQAGSAMMIPGL